MLLIYYLAFEWLFHFTPGKIILNTRVRTAEGELPGQEHIIKRSLARLIPFEAFSFFGATGWHDGLSKTSVFRYR